MTDIVPADLLDEIVAASHRAGAKIMEIYATDFEVLRKNDESPVTEADRAAEAAILPTLRALTPDIPIVAEEEMAAGVGPERAGPCFWLVDPLDGTKEFIRRNGEFTVNIALVEDGLPVLGVVFAPALGDTFAAAGPGTATYSNGAGSITPIAARTPPAEGVVVVSSRSHGDPEQVGRLLASTKVRETRIAGSSLKFCLVAKGEADIYPRYGPTSEWDTAAGHAVLAAAGGSVRTLDGRELRYGKPGWRNPEFIARGLEA